MENRILTLHPRGLKGVNIDRAKYDQVKVAILQALKNDRALTFKELNQAVSALLSGNFDGSFGWYITTVKLDLEARGEIAVSSKGSRQQIIRLADR